MPESKRGPEQIGGGRGSEDYKRLEALKQSAEKKAESSVDLKAERGKAEEILRNLGDKKESALRRERQSQHEAEKPMTAIHMTAKERRLIFRREIAKVQAQLPPLSRAFSKIVHNPVLERASEALEETVFRPSILIGGGLVGLIVGMIVYFVARAQGYRLAGSELVVAFAIGAILGLVYELLIRRGFKLSRRK